MVNLAKASYVTQAVTLLTHYSFDLDGYAVEDLVNHWLETYEAGWIRVAIVEALYQGRYKAFSVEQILAFWSRRGEPLRHFNREFERIICSRLPHFEYFKTYEVGESEPAVSKVRALPPISRVNLTPAQPSLLEEADQSEPEPERLAEETLEQVQLPPDPLPVAVEEPPQSVTVLPEEELSHSATDWFKDELQLSSEAPDSPPEDTSDSQRAPTDPIPPFEPQEDSKVISLHQAAQRRSRNGPPPEPNPIHEFVPLVQPNEFHEKLRAVAQPEEEKSAEG